MTSVGRRGRPRPPRRAAQWTSDAGAGYAPHGAGPEGSSPHGPTGLTEPVHCARSGAGPGTSRARDAVGGASLTSRTRAMSPASPLGSWWTDHLHLPGYDPIATAGPCRFDLRAAEQALGFCTQLLPASLSRWEAAIVLNLWGW